MSPTVISERSAYNLNGQRVVPFEVAAKLETQRGELLEALKLAPKTLHPDNPNDGGDACICSHCEFVRAARAAIAKAQS